MKGRRKDTKGSGTRRHLRVYYCADLHGSERCFRKFVRAGAFYDVDLLLLGGDVSGKVLIPIVVETNGWYSADFLGKEHRGESAEDLEALERNVRFNGFYPYRCSGDELEQLSSDPEQLKKVFLGQMIQTSERWMQIAEAELADSSLECIIMPGNDDERALDQVLSSSSRIVNGDGKVLDVDGYQIASLGVSNPTPWHSPRELPEPELETALRKLSTDLDPAKFTILNVHCPPYGSKLDEAPALTEDLRLVSAAGERPTLPVGSTSVRKIVQELQPTISFHGHIHESRAANTIGRTTVLNPGSRYNEGVLLGALIELEDDRVVRRQFVTG
jgi:uncharacterized protein